MELVLPSPNSSPFRSTVDHLPDNTFFFFFVSLYGKNHCEIEIFEKKVGKLKFQIFHAIPFPGLLKRKVQENLNNLKAMNLKKK